MNGNIAHRKAIKLINTNILMVYDTNLKTDKKLIINEDAMIQIFLVSALCKAVYHSKVRK